MTRDERTATIAELKEQFAQTPYFYLTDASGMTVKQVNNLRRLCFEKDVKLRVVKNTFIKKALENEPEDKNYQGVFDVLHGPTAVMFCDNANVPARLIEEFRKTSEKPLLKAAYIETAVYVGDDQLPTLAKLKSKNELLADVIFLLQSPMRNVVGALNSGGQKIAGLVKALQERGAAE